MEKEIICGIYKITSPSKKIYIGKSINISYRLKKYKWLQCKSQPKLYNSLIKYGFDKHKFEIIEQCDEKDLNIRERYYIELYQCFNSKYGLNLREGGDGGGRHSEESKLKNKEKHLGKKLTIEQCKAIGLRSKGNTNVRGKKWTEEQKQRLSDMKKGHIVKPETRIKISIAHKGKIISEETKKRLRELNKGRILTAEHKQKISNGNKGKIMSIETRRKISEAKKGVKLTQEHIQSMRNHVVSKETREKQSKAAKGRISPMLGRKHSEESKKKMSERLSGRTVWNKGIKFPDNYVSKSNKVVVQLSLNNEFINLFISIREATKNTGVSFSSISNCCCNRSKKAGGFKWMFEKDYNKKTGQPLTNVYF